jgi:hypothetical protein
MRVGCTRFAFFFSGYMRAFWDVLPLTRSACLVITFQNHADHLVSRPVLNRRPHPKERTDQRAEQAERRSSSARRRTDTSQHHRRVLERTRRRSTSFVISQRRQPYRRRLLFSSSPYHPSSSPIRSNPRPSYAAKEAEHDRRKDGSGGSTLFDEGGDADWE